MFGHFTYFEYSNLVAYMKLNPLALLPQRIRRPAEQLLRSKPIQMLVAIWRRMWQPSLFNRKRYLGLSTRGKLGSVAYTGLLMLLCFYLALELNLLWIFGRMPSMGEVREADMAVASEIYTADGKLLGKFFTENRTPVAYNEINPNLIRTLIAVEDVRFYQHRGIDVRALFSAVASTLKGDPRGASTITQQLAKNLFKTRHGSRGLLNYIPGLRIINAKGKEWVTAFKLELFFSKEEILTLYLNTVDFGRNTFGIKSAARTYFNTSPADLKLEESAMLVGMLKAPTYYNPVSNPKNALRRRNTVLGQLLKYGAITASTHDRLVQRPIQLQYSEETITDGLAPYFRTELGKWLRDYLKAEYGDEYNIYTSGLKIYTTLDSRMQSHAEAAMAEIMKRLQKRFDNHWQGRVPWELENGEEDTAWFNNLARTSEHYQRLAKSGLDEPAIWEQMRVSRPMEVFTWKGNETREMSALDSIRYQLQILQGGLIAEDPFTGHIKAWVGGINFEHFKYDHVKQSKRQPGSTFKPFVYAAAFENGYGPCDKLVDQPVNHRYREQNADGEWEEKEWAPRNADWNFTYSEYTLRRGMAKSVNSIAAQLTIAVGPEKVAATAKKMGIQSPLKPIPSIGLGVNDVSLFELVGAYASILNKGEWIEPHMVTRVEDMDGKLLFDYRPKRERALSEETAFLMTYMLRGGTEEPGGTSQALFEFDIFWRNEIGGKTGTSQNYSDGWFVGMTRDLVVGSWVGADQRRVRFRTSQTGEGSKTALPIAGEFLELLYKDELLERGTFPRPTVTIEKAWNCRTVLPRNDSTATDSLIVMPEDSLTIDG